MFIFGNSKVGLSGFHPPSFYNKIINFILPPSCVISGRPVEKQGMISPEVWSSLSFIAEPLCDCCGRPFDFEQPEGTLCGECLAERPHYNRSRSALQYNDSSRELILKFKHTDHTHAVIAFLPWMKRAGARLIENSDCTVPVPLHRWRFLKRRYNQAALIAQALSRETGLAYHPEAIERVRATRSQGHLSAKDRARNVRKAFTIPENRQPEIRGKRVLLIDDVYTTGATVNECALALLKAGCAEVNVLTLARVVKPGTLY